MPPRFRLCPICQKGFGSASINIHIPQCYDKALKQWRLNPIGPMPVMPQVASSPGRNTRSSGGLDAACGNGAIGARSLRQQHSIEAISEYPEGNANLHPCSKCGRKFMFDRIAYHESVCKGDSKRRVFNSSKQRCVDDEHGNASYGMSFNNNKKKKGGKTASTYSSYSEKPVGVPRTRWREQHQDFIEAIRAARRSESASKAMWGDPTMKAQPRQPDNRMRAPPAVIRHQKGIQSRQQRPLQPTPNYSRGSVSRPAPPKRPYGNAFGGGGERFSGYPGGGGGGGGKILNDNTTSLGMLQAFGKA